MNVGRALAEAGLDSDELRLVLHPIRYENLTLRPAPVWLRPVWGKGIQAMTIRRSIYVDAGFFESADRRRLGLLAIHEMVHVRQWADHGVLGFLWRYGRSYLLGRLKGLSHRDAYMGVGLEVEAREVTARFR